MQLHTPKRYGPRRQKRRIISLRWLWLYLLAPVVIFGSLTVYNNREVAGGYVQTVVAQITPPNFNPPTLTATIPAQNLEVLIQTRLKSGDMNDALAAMQEYSDGNVNDTKWHIARAEFLALRADNDPLLTRQAIDAGMSAINASPETSTAWAAEALALDWSNTANNATIEKQALIDILHAKDLNGADPQTLAILGGIYVTLNKFSDATASADAALKLDPNNSYAYFVKGQVAALSGDIKAATNLYKQAWNASQTDRLQWGGLYVNSLAGLYTTQGQIDLAKNILADGLTYDKNYPRLGRQLSNLYANQGDFPRAIAAAQQCTDTAPTYAPCWALLPSLFYNRTKEYDKAARAAENAAKYGSTETSPYYWGGQAYYEQNDCARAIPLFQKGYQLALKRNDSGLLSDFTNALNQCGITASQLATPTPGANGSASTAVPTLIPTAAATKAA